MNVAIILSGGVGSRMELELPKQYVVIQGRPIISYCLKVFIEDDNTDAIVIVLANEWKDFVSESLQMMNVCKPIYYAEPGETRQFSIYNALKVIREKGYSNSDIVIIHDAARPLVSHQLINRCYEGCKKVDGVMPVIPVKDTTYLSKNGKTIDALLDRRQLWAGQAPEAFVFGKYLKAHDDMAHDDLQNINGSTELAYKAGLKCIMVSGDPMNFKITTPEDLSNFESIICNDI